MPLARDSDGMWTILLLLLMLLGEEEEMETEMVPPRGDTGAEWDMRVPLPCRERRPGDAPARGDASGDGAGDGVGVGRDERPGEHDAADDTGGKRVPEGPGLGDPPLRCTRGGLSE